MTTPTTQTVSTRSTPPDCAKCGRQRRRWGRTQPDDILAPWCGRCRKTARDELRAADLDPSDRALQAKWLRGELDDPAPAAPLAEPETIGGKAAVATDLPEGLHTESEPPEPPAVPALGDDPPSGGELEGAALGTLDEMGDALSTIGNALGLDSLDKIVEAAVQLAHRAADLAGSEEWHRVVLDAVLVPLGVHPVLFRDQEPNEAAEGIAQVVEIAIQRRQPDPRVIETFRILAQQTGALDRAPGDLEDVDEADDWAARITESIELSASAEKAKAAAQRIATLEGRLKRIVTVAREASTLGCMLGTAAASLADSMPHMPAPARFLSRGAGQVVNVICLISKVAQTDDGSRVGLPESAFKAAP